MNEMSLESIFAAVRYVGTPIALVAFLIAVIAYTYRTRLLERRRLIDTAPGEERAALIDLEIGGVGHFDSKGLTREQRFELASTILRVRGERLRVLAITSVALALILSLLVAWSTRRTPAGVFGLTVDLRSDAGDPITNGEVRLFDGIEERTANVNRQSGCATFASLRTPAEKDSLVLTARAAGFAQSAPLTLHDVPRDVVHLTLRRQDLVVRGSVFDLVKRRVPHAKLDFLIPNGKAITCTADNTGDFDVVLPLPPGTKIEVRRSVGNRIGKSGDVTLPSEGRLEVLFDDSGDVK